MIATTATRYDRNAVRPLTGTLWVWEPEAAPALVKVTTVRWNGEEWWVGTATLLDYTLPEAIRSTGKGEMWNELSRFWEACHYVAAASGPPGTRGVTRRGAPQPGEVGES